MNRKMTVFWDVAPCSLAEVDRRFRGVYCLCHQGYGDSKYFWNVGDLRDYTANFPEDNIHTRHSENLKSHPSARII
jgi:hypothetical protein